MLHLPTLQAAQSGVVSRRQALDAGLADHDVRRLVRRREWAPVHPGVYVDHTGPLSSDQRAWAAVLVTHPSVLGGRWALAAGGIRLGVSLEGPVEIVVPHRRVVRPPPGIVVRRCDAAFDRALVQLSPPRVRVEDAVVDLAAHAPSDLEAIGWLTAALAARRTTADRLRLAVTDRSRLRRRALLLAVVEDLASGTHSALEHAYLSRVERPHGLPTGQRQVRVSGRRIAYRDVEYRPFGLVVELDGLAYHSSTEQRDADLDRDLDRAVDGRAGVRLGWGQVVGRPCRTATRIGRLLRQRGWTGAVRPAGCCPPGGSG